MDDWSKTDGRIYRVSPIGRQVMGQAPFDLHTADPRELVRLLGHPNKWFRKQAALETVSWRGETGELLPESCDARMALDGANPHAFDALCALRDAGRP